MLSFDPILRRDVVVVGARAAGASTAMLLARRGLDVVVLERGAHGADTLSTHAILRGGVMQLHRWGVLDDVVAAGTPAVRKTTFHVGGEPLMITVKPADGIDALYAPRRTVLDRLLVDHARIAGADVRFGVAARGLRRDASGRVTGVDAVGADGRALRVEARLVIGADGIRSTVARHVHAPIERAGTAAMSFAYAYFAGVPDDGFHWYFRSGACAGIVPTNDGQSCVFVGTTPERFAREVRADVRGAFHRLLAEADPDAASRLRHATPSSPFRSFPGLPGFVRRSWGPGWALVGDAGYFRDPISAHGLTDAFRDAELLARAVTSEGVDEYEALAGYQATRDELAGPLFGTVDQIATASWGDDRISTLLLQLSRDMTAEVDAVRSFDLELAIGARP